MTFDWREYLDLARLIQKEGGKIITQEAAFRCTVSRAYYAAYCHARNYARDKEDFSPSYKSEDHFHVREHFKKKGRVTIVDNLNDLRQWRNCCDYYDTVTDLSLLTTQAIKSAQGVFT